MGMILILLILSVFQGTKQEDIELSPDNSTEVHVGSNHTVTCTVKPCNGGNNVVIEFGNKNWLFSGPNCSNYPQWENRTALMCNVDQCTYSVLVNNIQLDDSEKLLTCSYRSQSGRIVSKAIHINVMQTDMSILPKRDFIDGENVEIHCFISLGQIYNTSVVFRCHGKEKKHDFDSGIANLSVKLTIDIVYNGTKCECSAVNSSENVTSEVVLRIIPYNARFVLSNVTVGMYGHPVTFFCQVINLSYPFAFGNWIYPITADRFVEPLVQTNSNNLTVNNCTYQITGKYYCIVVDMRKNSSIVAKASTQLNVIGPALLLEVNTVNTNNTCCIYASFQSFPEISMPYLWRNGKEILNVTETTRKTEDDGILQKHVFRLRESCQRNDVYGVLVSNSIFNNTYYFDAEGTFLKSPIVRMHDDVLIDGYPASVSCYNIGKTDENNLNLSCSNVSNDYSITRDKYAAIITLDFDADIEHDNSTCECKNTKTREATTKTYRVKKYTSENVSEPNSECESNSQIKLTCKVNRLPTYYVFGNWSHHYNGITIQELPGLSNEIQSSVEIPFCTYEDIGNYTCHIVDKRKNLTVFSSTTYLNVPGPPVIINTSVVKGTNLKGCMLNVNFYSWSSIVHMIWYRNGKKLISSEYLIQRVRTQTHFVTIRNIAIPIESKIATLQIKPLCDLEKSTYSFIAKSGEYESAYLFEQNDNTVTKILILSLIIASVMFLAGLNVVICRTLKGESREGWSYCKQSVYNTAKKERRETQFYEEIDMVIENLRRTDEVEASARINSIDSNYDNIYLELP